MYLMLCVYQEFLLEVFQQVQLLCWMTGTNFNQLEPARANIPVYSQSKSSGWEFFVLYSLIVSPPLETVQLLSFGQ